VDLDASAHLGAPLRDGEQLPESSTARRVLGHLSEADPSLTKKERSRLPAQIDELVERQSLSSVDAAIPRGQERIRVPFRTSSSDSKEPATALWPSRFWTTFG